MTQQLPVAPILPQNSEPTRIIALVVDGRITHAEPIPEGHVVINLADLPHWLADRTIVSDEIAEQCRRVLGARF